ncbi:rad21 rec8 n terminal domain-containing protein [Ophiostoma piceae UAMH 11346]|uniref:Rad21 rec8 n terminal domain-containing protein n=1 Tax=Ophiostoma piceae (strain UAMH 11346) TaxID=1262450 RepID=S3CWA9_OPHP1|nr:rad21 rec8 n terminal domain-containing protein [Ophiostoma piceae UAMH 11346]
MFYSTEILCDKRYALSTVWRAGNTAPGARTTGIRRKAVLDVSVEKTCGTIKDPPGAPIALRLQGTLLYGTARIYQEQCRYILNDSERTQRALLKLSSSLMDDKLESNAGRAKSAQIALPNDPCFDLDLFQLPPFDFDAPLDGSFVSQERQASWTNLSIGSRSSSSTQLPQLVLDADSSAGGSYAGGFQYSASGASNMPESPTPFGKGFNFPEEDNLLVDVGLFIDENGNIVEEEPRPEPQLPAFPHISSKQTANGMDVVPMIVEDDDDLFNPLMQQAVGGPQGGKAQADGTATKDSLISQTPSSPSTTSSPSTVHSRQARLRAARSNKTSFLDAVTQIPLSDYYSYVSNYSQHMERVSSKKVHTRDIRRTKDTQFNRRKAYDLTFGRGIFGVADYVKAHYPDHPLSEMFSGAALEEAVFGEDLVRAKQFQLETAEPMTPVTRRTREIRDGMDDEQEIELGRQPASAMSDNPSLALNRQSSVLPGSSQRGSAQHSATGIIRHPDGRLSSTGFPESPSFIERYSDEGMGFAPDMQSDMQSSARGYAVLPPISSPVAARGHGGDAGNATNNVGEELRNTSVFYRLIRRMATDEGLPRTGSKKYRWVEFGDAVAPVKQSRSAVVGAFMSLLTLATANKLKIHQSEADTDVIDRDIFIGAIPKSSSRKNEDRKGKGKKKRTYRDMSDERSDSLAPPSSRLNSRAYSSPMRSDEPYFMSGARSIEVAGAA